MLNMECGLRGGTTVRKDRPVKHQIHSHIILVHTCSQIKAFTTFLLTILHLN